MTRYAENTTVDPSKSRAEIERILTRYGADAFGYGYEDRRAVVQFRAHGRQIKFEIVTPERDEFKRTPTGLLRWEDAAIDNAWQKGVRQRWRALALVIKAKLEAVEAGIVTFEQEFLAHILLPSGQTTGDAVLPEIQRAYETGVQPDFSITVGGRLELPEVTGS